MDRKVLEAYVYKIMSDTCNRYAGKLREMGVVDEKQDMKLRQQIIDAKYDLLDDWVPFYARTIHEHWEGKSTLEE